MFENIEERLNKATSMQNLLDKIHDFFARCGTVASIQLAIDKDAHEPKAICCVEMENHVHVYAAKLVCGITPIGDKSFIFSFTLDPSLRALDLSNVMLWTKRDTFYTENPFGTQNALPAFLI